MAGRMSLGRYDTDFLKETLHAQQELLQKLYNELDVERESSAIAADEALSMILRLQGARAAMEMEASQYKRIAEEKMCHAQETLEIFQELIYQKEMQIASLEFQVQAYKFKLLSMGCDDLGACEIQYPENMLSRRNRVLGGESSSHSSVRRGNSLPPPVNDALSRRVSTEGSKSSRSSPKSLQEIKDVERVIRREHNTAQSYWDEIRKLDEQVKELANFTGFNDILTNESANVISGTCSMRDPSPENSPAKTDFPEYPEKVLSVQACGDSTCSTSIQDIFEVPICSNHHQDDTSHKKEKRKFSLEDESKNGKLDSVWEEIWKSDVKEKIDWEKKPLLSPGGNDNSPNPRDIKEKAEWEKKPLLSPGSNNQSPKPRDGKTSERQLLLKQPTYAVADFELQQFNRRLKQLEDERFVTRGHEINVETGDVEVRLLRDIREKVDSMQAEIASWRSKKPHLPEYRSPGCLKEVMLCFWP